MRTTLEDRKKQYRIIYEEMNKSARIQIKDLSSLLKINRHAAGKRLREALEKGYILQPQLRKRSYSNTKEYVYFFNCKNPFRKYKEYSKDMNVAYHAVMGGFSNFWMISNKEIDIEGNVLVSGLRSDYHVTHASKNLWKKSIQIMQDMVENFDSERYSPKKIIETHWDETLKWDSEFEILSREFKYDLRKKFSPIMKEHCISSQKIYEFLEKLPEYCTTFSMYFPETISAYDPYVFMFETDYEDFIIELFSELPTCSFFFKVSDKLFLHANVKKTSLRGSGRSMSDIGQLHIPLLVDDLVNKGILTSEAHAIVEYHWGKQL